MVAITAASSHARFKPSGKRLGDIAASSVAATIASSAVNEKRDAIETAAYSENGTTISAAISDRKFIDYAISFYYSEQMSDMNYKHLRYFWAVAHDGNLTRTADRLNVSQSALSVQIRKLEERLGHPLFERRNRQLLLTEAGRCTRSSPRRRSGT